MIKQDDWLVLSDRTASGGQTLPDMVGVGLFVVEFSLPLQGPCVLLDFQTTDGWPRTFTLFYDPEAGLVLIHRQGQSVARHALPGILPDVTGTARLTLEFDAPNRRWGMTFDLPADDERPPRSVKGRNPLPLRPADLQALSLPPSRLHRHRAVLWFGLTRGAALPARAPWIGLRTPIDTLRGPVAAGHLRPGELIRTADGGLLPLRRVTRLELPSCGSFAPVILRAPFFGNNTDILVSSDQRVAMSGPEVEYLFSEEEVLIEAGDLIDGRAALSEQRRAVANTLMLEFDHPALLTADGCTLLAARPTDAPVRRMLQNYEVLTLMALLGRAGHRRVA